MIRRPPRSTLFPTRRSSDLLPIRHFLGDLLELLDDHIYRLQNTALQRGRIRAGRCDRRGARSEEHTSELQSHSDLVCRLLLEKKNTDTSCIINSQHYK